MAQKGMQVVERVEVIARGVAREMVGGTGAADWIMEKGMEDLKVGGKVAETGTGAERTTEKGHLGSTMSMAADGVTGEMTMEIRAMHSAASWTHHRSSRARIMDMEMVGVMRSYSRRKVRKENLWHQRRRW